ncbi:hypothetical protein AAX05_05230 [Moraxella bovoculi]|uniref:ABC transporter domain-containing protein n=1 Tax=Moraxella bovoculi TaxID=386891 RepID=A0AAC8PXE2_9GAMM|nr:hypothetical protein AAX06_05725 [Moraxella bovoculi]AKG10573.1 hypothetical protein AAX05_05230 [Moraxella bovoculi]AKG12602.1 hypothetical protein AAX07_05785 [Moraxella bovoculi]AKG14556.1 hypothetical protein AAX11_05310 [Moraxella bovoculi]
MSYHAADRTLLDDVTFDLNFGQKVALVGRSGSGKSVLLQALADLLPLNDGTADSIKLNINGQLTPLSQISPPDYRSAVALFHQTPSLSDGTVLDNLTTPFDFKYHQNKTFDKDWHLQKLATLGKHDNFINQSIHELSGGERQIVSFLRTLQFNPTIALFDETTSALDNETANLLIRLVLDWHDDTKALIWVTHTPNEQQALGADLWRMDNGVLAV